MPELVHLRVHSDYSLSEGASEVYDLVKRAKALGAPAMALVDKDNLYAAFVFSDKASAAGVQPIVGATLHVETGEGRLGSVLALAKDEEGYRSLCALVRGSYEPRERDGKVAAPATPCVPAEALAEHSAGVILLTGGGAGGLLPQLCARDPQAAAEAYRWLLSVYGDRLYVEICRNGAEGEAERAVEDALLRLATGGAGEVACADGEARSEAPLVGTTDVWYATEDRHESWLLLKALASKGTVTVDGDRIAGDGPARFHMRSAAEMGALFADLPEALENAANVARRCAFLVAKRKPILPAFETAGGRSEAEELRHQAREGLDSRLAKAGIAGEAAAPYLDRLEFELGVIERMGFPGYFLIVSDFIKWGKSQGIPVGPGRGSGAGSVVAWALTITDLDPLEFGLLFERFLNPDRVSMPDFDIDFCEDRRVEVIRYVQEKYGSERVSQIATFGKIKSKTALKDAARVIIHEQYGTFGYGDVNDLTKLIPGGPQEPKSLDEAVETLPELAERVNSSPKLAALIGRAKGIEGLHRQVGAHAAGIVIGDRPLHELVPVFWDPKAGGIVCGFDMKSAEPAGMVKFDFLGLTTLSIMEEALQHIRRTRGVEVDLSAIPRDDREVYERFAAGRTVGVFQFESGGMVKTLRQIRPERLEDLIAIVALFRPGPMAYIDTYASRKAGLEETVYPEPVERTRGFLEETYGIMVYQEQVMQVAQACAGYSLGQADLLRRAMGKKIQAEMVEHRRIFVHGDEKATPPVPGAVRLGMDPKVAEALFDDISSFADYGFNKSHAAAYAWISYQSMWLKVHYPVEYLSAVMTYALGKQSQDEDLSAVKDELDQLGIALLGPDVNASHGRFRPEETPKGWAVRFGLTAIKQISGDMSFLVDEREASGAFTSLEDYHRRTAGRFNKAQVERLAEAGAFDGLARSRRQAASVLAWLGDRKDKAPKGQADMFGGALAVPVPASVLDVPEWGDAADREFKAVGFYFSSHPIDTYVPRLVAAGVRRRKSFADYMVAKKVANLDDRKLCVLVDDVKMRTTKRGTAYVEAYVSERGDAYRVSCYDSYRTGFRLDDFRRVFDAAKASRKPVVMVCSLALDQAGEGVWVNGRQAWGVDAFLAGIRGDFVITLDPAAVRLTRPEEKAVAAIGEAEAGGSLAPREAEARRREIRDAAFERRVGEVRALLDQRCRSEEEAAFSVTLSTPGGDERLDGRFRFSPQIEQWLRQQDFVSSMEERVAEAPAQAPAPVRRAG